ncbi:MAG: FAD-binding protein [Deltaproteobacteria bacterium]|uniref:FAD-binding protein n=1 Tax=Candidatus Zymogenus saltonus TaxID=2844893 RepID=A0A9D8PSJ9_9DELT|nr:FAD-binding protein [Candidatus Zymogenus saltonus]
MEKTKIYDREIETDVLAVGGGGAGITAAISAFRLLKGKGKVTIATKGPPGRSGNTFIAAAGISMDGESAKAYGYDADESFTKQVWFEEIVRQGFHLSDQRIVVRFVETAALRVKELLDWGGRAGEYFHFVRPACFFTSGKAVGSALRQGLKEHPGIEIVEDVIITDILTGNGGCAGAIGIDVYSGEVILFKAKTVILGTGGFQPFSFKCTASDMTGDGIGIALRAGLPVADMEFPLCIPGVCITPAAMRGSIFTGIYSMVSETIPGMVPPAIVNGSGEPFLDKAPRALVEIAKTTGWIKLIYAYYWGREIAEGRGGPGGGVYFSFKDANIDDFKKGFETLSGMLSLWYKTPMTYQGEDISIFKDEVVGGRDWEVGLGHEYSNGGIVVDENGATALPGLYAAGEASCGCFGAYRGNRALVEMIVQGHAAGEHAAAYVRGVGEAKVDDNEIEKHVGRITKYIDRKRGVSPSSARKALESTADGGFGFMRHGEGISRAMAEVEEIKGEMLPEMATRSKSRVYNLGWIEAMAVENLALCLEAGLRAAEMRRESRGTHIRRDFPKVDNDNFLVRIFHLLKDGKLIQSFEKPTTTKIEPLKGSVENVMEYILSCRK